MKKHLIKFIIPAVAALVMQGCTSRGEDPGVEYAPDMYVSKGYEPMSQVEGKAFQITTVSGKTAALSADGKTMREPAFGTIPRDLDFEGGYTHINNYLWMQYPYSNSLGGKDSASKMLKNPIPLNEATLASGKKFYNRTCAACHGADGLGKGLVAAKVLGVPSYKSARITGLSDGGAYHSITYGINNMGPYASVLTPQQRWEVIHYINYLKNN